MVQNQTKAIKTLNKVPNMCNIKNDYYFIQLHNDAKLKSGYSINKKQIE